MTRIKVSTEVDSAMEKHSNITIESCTSYRYDDGTAKVLVEAVAGTRQPIQEYRTIQVILYDEDNDIMARTYTNWTEFGLRQSAEFSFKNLDSDTTLTKVKVFPTTE